MKRFSSMTVPSLALAAALALQFFSGSDRAVASSISDRKGFESDNFESGEGELVEAASYSPSSAKLDLKKRLFCDVLLEGPGNRMVTLRLKQGPGGVFSVDEGEAGKNQSSNLNRLVLDKEYASGLLNRKKFYIKLDLDLVSGRGTYDELREGGRAQGTDSKIKGVIKGCMQAP